jgi:hypothetical protein
LTAEQELWLKVGLLGQWSTYLSGELEQLALDGEVALHDLRVVLAGPLQDLLDREGLVEGHTEVLDLRGLDHALGVVGHVTEMPGGHGVLGGTVSTNVNSEEVVSLVLALELGSEFGLWDPGSGLSSARCVHWLHLGVPI